MGVERQTATSSEFLTHIGIRSKNVIDLFIYLHCLKCVLIKATCEREIFKLFQVTKCKGCYSCKLEKNNRRKILKLIFFYLVEQNSAFSCRL